MEIDLKQYPFFSFNENLPLTKVYKMSWGSDMNEYVNSELQKSINKIFIKHLLKTRHIIKADYNTVLEIPYTEKPNIITNNTVVTAYLKTTFDYNMIFPEKKETGSLVKMFTTGLSTIWANHSFDYNECYSVLFEQVFYNFKFYEYKIGDKNYLEFKINFDIINPEIIYYLSDDNQVMKDRYKYYNRINNLDIIDGWFKEMEFK